MRMDFRPLLFALAVPGSVGSSGDRGRAWPAPSGRMFSTCSFWLPAVGFAWESLGYSFSLTQRSPWSGWLGPYCGECSGETERPIGSAGGLLPPPPTPPDMRVRVRRFLAVHPD